MDNIEFLSNRCTRLPNLLLRTEWEYVLINILIRVCLCVCVVCVCVCAHTWMYMNLSVTDILLEIYCPPG